MDLQASVQAAQQMMNRYGVATNPVALHSLHSLGQAIDMNISWPANRELTIADKTGEIHHIRQGPHTGMNHELWQVGATYKVIKFCTEAGAPSTCTPQKD